MNLIHPDVTDSVKELPTGIIVIGFLMGGFLVLLAVAVWRDQCDRAVLSPRRDPDADHYPVTYIVFIYTSMWPLTSGTCSTFSLSLHGSKIDGATNVFEGKVPWGSMVHLVYHTHTCIGPLKRVTIRLNDQMDNWHVNQIVVSDHIMGEDVLFPVWGWLGRLSQHTELRRATTRQNNAWRSGFISKLWHRVLSYAPFLLIALPGQVRSTKLDRMLAYGLGMGMWAMFEILYFKADNPNFLWDDCKHQEANEKDWKVDALKFSINTSISIVSTIMTRFLIANSVLKNEIRPKNKMLPLPHTFAIVGRVVSVLLTLTSLIFVGLLTYSLAPLAREQWVADLGPAFAYQVLSQMVRAGLMMAVKDYLLYKRDQIGFLNLIHNPEGSQVSCPECHAYPDIPLNIHMAQHAGARRHFNV